MCATNAILSRRQDIRHCVARRRIANIVSNDIPWLIYATAICGVYVVRLRDAWCQFAIVLYIFPRLIYSTYGILSRRQEVGMATLDVGLPASCPMSSLSLFTLFMASRWASRCFASRRSASACQYYVACRPEVFLLDLELLIRRRNASRRFASVLSFLTYAHPRFSGILSRRRDGKHCNTQRQFANIEYYGTQVSSALEMGSRSSLRLSASVCHYRVSRPETSLWLIWKF
jgi:hypothetical protein